MLINVRCSWKRKALPCMVDAPLTFLCLPNTCSGPQGRSGHPGRPGNAVTNTRMHTSAHVRMSQRGRKRAHHTQFSGRLAHTHSHTYVCVCVCVCVIPLLLHDFLLRFQPIPPSLPLARPSVRPTVLSPSSLSLSPPLTPSPADPSPPSCSFALLSSAPLLSFSFRRLTRR